MIEKLINFEESKNGVIRVGGIRSIVISTGGLGTLCTEVEKIMGRGAAAVLYSAGIEDGKYLTRKFKDGTVLGKKIDDPEELLRTVLRYLTSAGWGLLDIVKLSIDEKHLIVRSSNPPEADYFLEETSQKTKYPADNILRGLITGVAIETFETDLDGIENKCRAIKDSHCEIEVKRFRKFKKNEIEARYKDNSDRHL
ncbi:MAG: hypothetical protein ACE5K4_10635 [Candidatus Hydrothermarchaeota archaeon]